MDRKKITGIYRITNPKGAVYIGVSKHFISRLSKYRKMDCKAQPIIYNSLKKYGFDSHEIKLLHELPKDVSNTVLSNYEKFYVQQYKSCGVKMLNATSGGCSGFTHSDETKRRIGLKNSGRPSKYKGVKRSAEICRRMSEGMRRAGKPPMSEERRRLFAERMKPFHHDPKRTEAIGEGNRGKKRGVRPPQSEETKRKRSESMKKTLALKKCATT